MSASAGRSSASMHTVVYVANADSHDIAILALEGVSRRDFSMKVKEKMLLAGFVLLLMLMVTVIYNDLMRIQWIEKLVPWR